MPNNTITQILKRSGEIAPFDQAKLVSAIYKATEAVGKPDMFLAQKFDGFTLYKLIKDMPAHFISPVL